MATETLRPDGVGAEENLSPGGGNNWSLVDEGGAGDGDATVVIASPGEDWRDLYGIADSGVGAGVISNVRVYARAKKVNEADTYLWLALSSGGVGQSGLKVLTWPDYAEYYHDWPNPPGGGPWTWPKIDAMQAGVRMSCAAKAQGWCTQVWVVVTYTAVWLGKISGVTNPGKIMGVARTAIKEVKGVAGV